MSSTAGPAPIVDFDGTLAALVIDWSGLRASLGVPSLRTLWRTGGLDAWAPVTDVELVAAARAAPIAATVQALERAAGFAVLSANSESAIHAFLERFPSLAARARLVVGRETLRGPKNDPECFNRAFELCRAATDADRGGAAVVYIGDTTWELDLARRAGARVLHVDELAGS